jgi:hypothetical protein
LISESTTINRSSDGIHTIPEGSEDGGDHCDVLIVWISEADTTSAVVTRRGSGCSSVISVTPPSHVSSPESATNRLRVSGSSVLSVLGANVIASGETNSTEEVSYDATTSPSASTASRRSASVSKT